MASALTTPEAPQGSPGASAVGGNGLAHQGSAQGPGPQAPPDPVVSRIRGLSDSQCYELAHLHRVRGLLPTDIAARWPTWTPSEISRALHSKRVEAALDLIESDARTSAGSVLTLLYLRGHATAERLVDVAQGKATYTNDEGSSVHFSEKSQLEAMLWHADRLLPDKPQAQPTAGFTINNTIVATTLTETVSTLAKISALLPGAVSSPMATGSGEPPAPGMERFLRMGRDQLVPNDDVPLTIDAVTS